MSKGRQRAAAACGVSAHLLQQAFYCGSLLLAQLVQLSLYLHVFFVLLLLLLLLLTGDCSSILVAFIL